MKPSFATLRREAVNFPLHRVYAVEVRDPALTMNSFAYLPTAKDRSSSPLVIETVGRGPILTREFTIKLKGSFIDQNLLLCTDANNSYKKYCKEHNIKHKALNLSKKQRVAEKHLHLQNVNATHSRLKGWMSRFHGVASKYLQNYMNYF